MTPPCPARCERSVIEVGTKIEVGSLEVEAKAKAEVTFRVLSGDKKYGAGTAELSVGAKLKLGPAEAEIKAKVYEGQVKFGTGTSDKIAVNRKQQAEAAGIDEPLNVKQEVEQDSLNPPPEAEVKSAAQLWKGFKDTLSIYKKYWDDLGHIDLTPRPIDPERAGSSADR